MSEEQIGRKLSAYLNGDKSAFDYIYEATYKAVYFTALYVVHTKQAAEDIVQETYVKALNALSTFKEGTNFTGWLCGIARNAAIDEVRKRSRETLCDFQETTPNLGAVETETPYLFDLAQKSLADDEYRIVMMCQVAGYKRREVAEIMGMPIATVTWKNNQALKKLKQLLKEGK